MKVLIESKRSKSGKERFYFPTVNGLRINGTNFRRKWEAVKLAKAYITWKQEQS